jgi:uncharacterized protein with GYD domain
VAGPETGGREASRHVAADSRKGEVTVPTYVVLYRFTDQGRLNMRETVRRAGEIQKENEERGFRVLGHFWTQGQYDLVSVVEAPSEEAMLGGLFSVASAGNVVSETLRAFSDEEMQRALA